MYQVELAFAYRAIILTDQFRFRILSYNTLVRNSLFSLFFVCFSLHGYGQSLSGKWMMEADITDLGKIHILLDFEQKSDTSFYASSRPEALKNIIGGIKYLFAKRQLKFKNGALVHIYSGRINGDSLRGVITTPMTNLYFAARLEDGQMNGALFGTDKSEHYYNFTAKRAEQNCLDYDYGALVVDIKSTFREHIYDPRLMQKRRWRKFFRKLDALSSNICDDIEMLTYFSFSAGNLKMSHINLLKTNPWEDLKTADTAQYSPQVSHKKWDDTTAYIAFKGFQLADTTLVRAFFNDIIEENVPRLIIDLRGCGGGDYSSMFLAQYLSTEPGDAGFFIGNKYYRRHRSLPDEATLAALPYYSGSSLDDFFAVIQSEGLLKGRVVPDPQLHYSGEVYALIDAYSASATEPIAYYLKQHKLATLVGERTAGAMLSSFVVPAREPWHLILPLADYYTSDRFRIEQKGVKPDVKVKSDMALEQVVGR